MLELVDVHAGYGRIEVLHGIDLEVPQGTVTAVLGPNGAGKTTLLKTISGRLRPTKGHIHVGGVHVNDAAPDALARAGLCTIPEGRGVFANLTVLENLRLAAYGAPGTSSQEIYERAFAQFPRLADRAGQLAGSMSGGEQQMLAIARALVVDPALLLIDELSMGLAPKIVAELYDIVAGIAAQGTTIVVVEQFAETALKVASQVAVLVHGRVVDIDEPGYIRPRLQNLYLTGAA